MSPRVLRQPPPDEKSDWEPPAGFHIEWVEQDTRRLATDEEQATRTCRRPGCRRTPVMALLRSNGWWLYCDWHMYGSEIRDGRVMSRRAVKDTPPTAPKTDGYMMGSEQ